MQQKSIKISVELFGMIVKWFLLGQENREAEAEIKRALGKKIREMSRRDIYHQYKIAPEGESKEKLRQEYLDEAGVLKDFRWEAKEPHH